MNARAQPYFLRRAVVVALLLTGAALLAARAVYLQAYDQSFLRGQGEARHTRVVPVAAHRGMLLDRHGEALAASTPVDSVWANPREFSATPQQFRELARLLEIPPETINRAVYERANAEFAFLKRQISPDVAQRVMALRIPGLALQREYRRYYPAGEVAAHVLGFTDVDDHGQEGIERAFDATLRGVNGKHKIIRDPFGRVVEDVESIKEPEPGRNVTLSLDRRVQYLAYRELKAAVQRHGALAGTAIVLDVQTGEVLAMVNQPAFNPNNRDELRGASFRNRAVTDVFEPGSTVKPFTVAAALESGKYHPATLIDTAPGYMPVGRALVRDPHNYGRIDVTTVLQKSSNIGVSKMALDLPPEQLWNAFARAGFGRKTSEQFPGESGGVLTPAAQWRDVERVTASYGYGLSVTALQLARAYAALGDDGRLHPVSFLRVEDRAQARRQGEQVFRPELAAQLRRMLETVAQEGGTGTHAGVPGYRIAGKTGTVKKHENGGYSDTRYLSLFAGVAPAREPRLAMVVMIDEPQGKLYHGGDVAAPVFGNVMAGALRLLNIPPDDVAAPPTHVALIDAQGCASAAAHMDCARAAAAQGCASAAAHMDCARAAGGAR
jgi:cell division protein FtsI (penicillin-binding protein 3)